LRRCVSLNNLAKAAGRRGFFGLQNAASERCSDMNVRGPLFFATALLAVFVASCSADNPSPLENPMKIQLTSQAFTEGQPIPRKQAHDDQNISPALQWSGVPPAAKSLALICDDPDAPMGTWVHWVIYDLPPTETGLAEGIPPSPELPDGARQGVNDFKTSGYGGPQPPPGKPHRYFFKLYALDVKLELKPGLTKKELLPALAGHVLAEGQLMGTCQKQ
jgi:Raf kinase inhibitor-like YbhB/YbcL family protein